MGTAQSKKRWKDMQKKKRGSISSSADVMTPSRSLSMDALHPPGITPIPSTCPLCPHCRYAVSWSSDHSLTHSLCLHHARQGHQGQELGEMVDKEGFQSCPDCVQRTVSSSSSSQFQRCLRLCEISNQDFSDEMSTMSLNRNFPGRYAEKQGGIVQSKSAEFTQLGRIRRGQVCHDGIQTKENVNPDFCDNSRNSENQSAAHLGLRTTRTGEDGQVMMTTKQRQLPTTEMFSRQPKCLSTVSSHQHRQSLGLNSNNNSKETKSNLSLLEDDEVVMSRWVRRKQMTQELRNLRMHLQNQEDAKQNSHSINTKDSFANIKLNSFRSDNNNSSAKENNFAKKTYTSTNNRTVTEACLVSHKDSSCFNSSKNLVSNKTSTSSTSISATCNTDSTTTTTTTSPTRKSIRSKFSKLSNYRYLDDHPVMTRLQNEHNNRRELMERRIEEIRINAMHEAERRRFAEIFPAKDDDSETQKLLREARESLERMKEEKRIKADQHQHRYQNQPRASSAPPRSDWEEADSRSQDDSGEIIPVVHVLSSSRETTPVPRNKSQKRIISVSQKCNRNNNKKSIWLQGEWPDINLGKPLTWLWLPFMLFPLVLRMLLSMLFNNFSSSSSTPSTPRRNGNSSDNNSEWSYPERDRALSRDRRKKSC